MIAPDQDSVAARLDLGVAATRGDRLLAWMPSALPKAPGWLARPARRGRRAAGAGPAVAGADLRGRLDLLRRRADGEPSAPARSGLRQRRGCTAAAAPDARPARRDRADRPRGARGAGGFAGRLFGDAFAHVDLADRLHRGRPRHLVLGRRRVLDPRRPRRPRRSPPRRSSARIDAALLDRRAATAAEARRMKALVLSHAHPTFSIGGAQVASYNLFQGLKEQEGWDAHYLAGVGPPVARHRATPLMSLGQGPGRDAVLVERLRLVQPRQQPARRPDRPFRALPGGPAARTW